MDYDSKKEILQQIKRNYGVQLSDLVANITYTKFEYNTSNHLFETYIKPKILGECSYPEVAVIKNEKDP